MIKPHIINGIIGIVAVVAIAATAISVGKVYDLNDKLKKDTAAHTAAIADANAKLAKSEQTVAQLRGEIATLKTQAAEKAKQPEAQPKTGKRK